MTVDFTAEARVFWDAIPEEEQSQLLRNVWCTACGEVRTIVSFKGRVERRDLVLDGHCGGCGGPVARLIEGAAGWW